MTALQRVALAVALAAIASCRQAQDPGEDPRADRQRPLVYTTIAPLQFFVQRLAGDLVECQTLLPADAEAQRQAYLSGVR